MTVLGYAVKICLYFGCAFATSKMLLLLLFSNSYCHHNFDYIKILDRCVCPKAVSDTKYFEWNVCKTEDRKGCPC